MKSLCFILFLLFTFVLFGCLSPTESVTQKWITVKGVVKERYSKTAVKGVTVHIDKLIPSVLVMGKDPMGKAVTNLNGEYIIRFLCTDLNKNYLVSCKLDSVIESSSDYYILEGKEDFFEYYDAIRELPFISYEKEEQIINMDLNLVAKSFVTLKVRDKDGANEIISGHLVVKSDTSFNNQGSQVIIPPIVNSDYKYCDSYWQIEPITVVASLYRLNKPPVSVSKTITPVPGKVSVFYLEY